MLEDKFKRAHVREDKDKEVIINIYKGTYVRIIHIDETRALVRSTSLLRRSVRIIRAFWLRQIDPAEGCP